MLEKLIALELEHYRQALTRKDRREIAITTKILHELYAVLGLTWDELQPGEVRR